ncbi:MAG: DEAD/DEAH box helicase, partial [Chloroflexi bacterium]|nr:DEAD/DEAH box helicase [Chloroflexota bacterium]
MGTITARLALKEQLPRAWPAFFERHGSFTAVQEAAMPALLAGHDALVVAPTAGGKTEAALAPLVERYCTPAIPGAARGPAGPPLLYIVPTRALVNDLAARLHGPLDTLN